MSPRSNTTLVKDRFLHCDVQVRRENGDVRPPEPCANFVHEKAAFLPFPSTLLILSSTTTFLGTPCTCFPAPSLLLLSLHIYKLIWITILIHIAL
jgi:hypothetical protein